MTGPISVRRAGGADVPAMFRVFNGNLDAYFAPESLEFFMLQWPRGQFVACDLLGRVVGALSAYLLEDGAACVALLAVDEGMRDMGAGSALMDALTAESIGVGASRIQLETRVTNTAAISFYERRGFRRTEFLPGFYDNGGDGVRMVLDLGPSSAGNTPPRRPL